jgi:succinoglycan biosynthesis transport protein ExoP
MADASMPLETTPSQGTGDGISLAEAIQSIILFFRRYRRTIFATMLLALAAAVAYLNVAKPSYTARATLVLDMRNIFFSQQKSMVTDIALDSAFVESAVETVKSRSLALTVIDKLHLADKPEFTKSTGGLLGDMVEIFNQRLHASELPSDFEMRERALNVFQAALTAKRVGLSFIIEVGFRSRDPELAAKIANALADGYLLDQAGARLQAARRTTAWLQDSLLQLRSQATSADRQLVEFKNKNNIVNAAGRLINEQQLAEFNSQLSVASSQRAEAQARLDDITKILTSGSPADYSADPAVADSLKNDVISKLRTQYLEAVRREAEFSMQYGPAHTATVRVRDQIRELRNSILDELRRIAETFKSDLEVATRREQNVQRRLTELISGSEVTNEAQVTMRELESSAQTYRAIHDEFLHREMETLQQQTFPGTEGRILSVAERPLKANWPRASVVLLLALLGGFALGTILALFRDMTAVLNPARNALPGLTKSA